jgi:hypothetical protein
MLTKMILRIGLAGGLIWSAAACASTTATPTATAVVVTDVPTPTTNPATDTPVPTNVPAPTDASGQSSTQPGDQPTAAAGAPPAAAASQPAGGSAAGGAPADVEKYVSQNMADQKQLRPGVPEIITWTVQNAGTVGWTADYTANYFAGVKAQVNSVRFGKTVAPNGMVSISVTFTTPTIPGNYNMWWKLTNLQGQNFGDVDFSFTVTNTPGQVTPTP